MDATAVKPGDALELSELRRRAYGTTEGIGDDLVALARLEHLENAARAGRGDSDVPPAVTSAILSREDAGPAAQQSAVPPAEEVAIALPQERRGVSRHGTTAMGAALVSGFVIALALSAPGTSGVSSAPEPAPTSTLGAELPPLSLVAPVSEATLAPDIERTRLGLYGAADWAYSAGFDTDTLQAYQRLGSLTPWIASKRDYPARCILLITHEGRIFSHMGCAEPGESPTLGLVVTKDSHFSVGSKLPVGSAVMFVDTGTDIEVSVALPDAVSGLQL